jgi:hypothetical protein
MASEQPKRKRGGQPKPPDQRKRNNVTIRMRDDLRDKVERAAAAAGRSMSEQIAHTLADAFASKTSAGSAEINAKLDSLAQAIERLAAVPPSLPQVLRDALAVLAGTPSPAQAVAAGPPSAAQVVAAGPPSPAQVLRDALASAPPSMKEMFAPIASPPPEPYPQPPRLVVHYSRPASWAETPVITINNKLDSEAA